MSEREKPIQINVQEAIRAAEEKARSPLSPAVVNKIRTDFADRPARQQLRAANHELKRLAETTERAIRQFAQGGLANRDVEGQNPLRTLIRQSVINTQPIRFLLFWGAGNKTDLNHQEIDLFGKLNQLVSAVYSTHAVGAKIDLIFADIHAIAHGFGRWSPPSLSSGVLAYFEQVKLGWDALELALAARFPHFEYRSHRLSMLYAEEGMPIQEPALINDDPTFERHKKYLIRNAKALVNLGVSEDPELLARRHSALRQGEKSILERRFMGHILLAVGRSRGARGLVLPEMMPGVFLGGKEPWFN